MEIARNEFTCKFQATLQMSQKVIIRFGYRLHPETISPLFADLSSTTHV